MEEIIDKLKKEVKNIRSCLNDAGWACTDSKYHKQIRFDYRKRVRNLNKAIKILKEAV